MRRCPALIVLSVDVDARLQQQPNGLDDVLLCLVAAGRIFFARAHTRRHHDPGHARTSRQLCIRALVDEQLDDRRIRGLGGSQQRRGAGAEHRFAAAIELRAVGAHRRAAAALSGAPCSTSILMTSKLVSWLSSSFGEGDCDCGIVCMSTARRAPSARFRRPA
jgi:hypothetical protein